MSEVIAQNKDDSHLSPEDKKDQIVEVDSSKSPSEVCAHSQPKNKCQIIHLVNPNSQQKKQELASHFEPLLTALEMQPNASAASEKVQYYVEVGGDEVLNLKDGVQYTLVQTDDNNFQLCETLSDSKTDVNTDGDGTWSPIVSLIRHDESAGNETDTTLTPGEFSTLKALRQKAQSTPCQGQGDESGNSILETSNPSLNLIASDNKNFNYGVHQVIHEEEATQSVPRDHRIYATLGTKRGRLENESCVNYETPRNVAFEAPIVSRSPMTVEPFRFAHPRPRLLYTPDTMQHPVGVRPSNIAGYRQRRPRQAWHPYQTVVRSSPLDSSTTSIESTSSDPSLSTSGSDMSLCTSSCNESRDSSLEYPRAPNNTPNTGELVADTRSRNFDPLWLPKVNSQLENMQYYVPIDLRESHNQKERRRRLRIKLACQTLRNLVPGINERTDKATVFEHVVRYLTFIKQVTTNKYDMEFIEKCYM